MMGPDICDKAQEVFGQIADQCNIQVSRMALQIQVSCALNDCDVGLRVVTAVGFVEYQELGCSKPTGGFGLYLPFARFTPTGDSCTYMLSAICWCTSNPSICNYVFM